MKKLSSLALVCAAIAGLPNAPAYAVSAAEQLAAYTTRSGAPAQPARGQQLFTSKHGKDWSCASCHTATPTVEGKHATTAKAIGPLAPAFNPERFADTAKTEKWFRRNCNAALARRQTVVLEAPVPCTVTGDDMLLGVLVRNLLDNALRYSPDGAQVRVSVALESGQPVLRVQDSGPGMTEPEIARLGERFFRVLGSDQPGSGLGWSIVRRIGAVLGSTLRSVVRNCWAGWRWWCAGRRK